MTRLIASSIVLLLLLAVTVRSLFTTDRLSLSSISDRFSHDPPQSSSGWGLILDFHHGGACLEWRRATQHPLSSRWVLPPPTGINSGFADGRYALHAPVEARLSFAGIEYLFWTYSHPTLYSVRF